MSELVSCKVSLGNPPIIAIIKIAFGDDSMNEAHIKYFHRHFKLKGTNFAIREDFSAAVRQVRSKLIRFAKEQGGPFKLRFDKVVMNGKSYYYDVTSDILKVKDQ